MTSPLPKFSLDTDIDMPELVREPAKQWAEQLTACGFQFSHRVNVQNAICWRGDQEIAVDVFKSDEECAYALITRLFHKQDQVLFTNYYAQGQRMVTAHHAGSLMPSQVLDASHPAGRMPELHLFECTKPDVTAMWEQHKTNSNEYFFEQQSLRLTPEQHLLVERGFYLRYLKYLVENRMLPTVNNLVPTAANAKSSTISSAGTRQAGHETGDFPKAVAASTLPGSPQKPVVRLFEVPQQGIQLALQKMRCIPPALATAAALMGISVYFTATSIQTADSIDPLMAVDPPLRAELAKPDQSIVKSDDNVAPAAMPANTTATITQSDLPSDAHQEWSASREQPPLTENQKTVIASASDEMWHISVENAEFYLMSNDGDPAPWIRSAKRIAATFDDQDPRLARTYFLSALVERDYLVAEQHYKRALEIQTASLGLYHSETAQTLEALAWLAEHEKDSLEEAISHQRLALNIYQNILDSESEDVQAAKWKLEYFESRLAGTIARQDDNHRLLPALAKFDR